MGDRSQDSVVLGDGYTLTQMIATGGMAEIYLGYRDVAMDMVKPVVIKRLRPKYAGDDHVTAMFLDEARLSLRLAHPQVVSIFDIGDVEGVPFIAMEYVRGDELNELARRGLELGYFLPRHLAVEIIRQAALGLGYCHALRDDFGAPLEMVHRDVSPNNLLISEDGFVKLIDFGIATFAGQLSESESVVPGKLSYMSPEQVRGDSVDYRSDIFSLGVILYEMTTARRLFRGAAQDVRSRITTGTIEPPTFFDPDYPGVLEAIVMKCLEPDPRDRYASAYQVSDELNAALVSVAAPVGVVELARYQDELGELSGGVRRDELWPDAEEGEELDFGRGEPRAPSQPPTPMLGSWDDVEEGAAVVAAALGVEEAAVGKRARAPTSDFGLLSSAGSGEVGCGDVQE